MNIGGNEGMHIERLDLAKSQHVKAFESITPRLSALYYCSNNLDDILSRPRVAIVGSRRLSPYGRSVTEQFARELAQRGAVIISGLAYGVDAVAHQAALDAGGLTAAVLASSLSRIYPTAHTGLARRIVEQGGGLFSEYPVGSEIAYKSQFVARNRIVSGMSDALLITEAAINSGTMHTARFALEQGKDVFAVPGNITSLMSAGTNNLIRSGAMPATSVDDVLSVLGIAAIPVRPAANSSDPHEQLILDLLAREISDGSQLLAGSSLSIEQFNQTLTMMELTGKVRALGADRWVVR